MTEPEKYQRYVAALDEARDVIDRARLRASELRGSAMAEGHEDAMQTTLTVNSTLHIESKKLQIDIMDIHKQLYKIKFK
ncbi:hypothetical protein [Reichenbachiella sp.]|uniref:hypothetical protein n=1 Tax=Reichenbachiella sp. TaxID=2184521 RepID=UPI003B5A753E